MNAEKDAAEQEFLSGQYRCFGGNPAVNAFPGQEHGRQYEKVREKSA